LASQTFEIAYSRKMLRAAQASKQLTSQLRAAADLSPYQPLSKSPESGVMLHRLFGGSAARGSAPRIGAPLVLSSPRCLCAPWHFCAQAAAPKRRHSDVSCYATLRQWHLGSGRMSLAQTRTGDGISPAAAAAAKNASLSFRVIHASTQLTNTTAAALNTHVVDKLWQLLSGRVKSGQVGQAQLLADNRADVFVTTECGKSLLCANLETWENAFTSAGALRAHHSANQECKNIETRPIRQLGFVDKICVT
jgi:hypothetical protein